MKLLMMMMKMMEQMEMGQKKVERDCKLTILPMLLNSTIKKKF